MRGIGNARGAVDDVAEVVVVAVLGPAGMQSAAHANGDAAGGRGIAQALLHRQYRGDGIRGVVEHRVDSVAARLHDDTPVALDHVPRDRVVASQRQAHALGIALPELAAAFDVREQKGGDGRQYFHARTPFAREMRWTRSVPARGRVH